MNEALDIVWLTCPLRPHRHLHLCSAPKHWHPRSSKKTPPKQRKLRRVAEKKQRSEEASLLKSYDVKWSFRLLHLSTA